MTGQNSHPYAIAMYVLHFLHQFETENAIPQSREELSPTSTTNSHSALNSANEALKRVVPIDRSKTWERALTRIKWVMDMLGSIVEVRIIPF